MPDLEKIPHVGDGAIDTAVYVQSKEIMLMAFKLGMSHYSRYLTPALDIIVVIIVVRKI